MAAFEASLGEGFAHSINNLAVVAATEGFFATQVSTGGPALFPGRRPAPSLPNGDRESVRVPWSSLVRRRQTNPRRSASSPSKRPIRVTRAESRLRGPPAAQPARPLTASLTVARAATARAWARSSRSRTDPGAQCVPVDALYALPLASSTHAVDVGYRESPGPFAKIEEYPFRQPWSLAVMIRLRGRRSGEVRGEHMLVNALQTSPARHYSDHSQGSRRQSYRAGGSRSHQTEAESSSVSCAICLWDR